MLQTFFNGLVNSLWIAVVAVSFSLVYVPTRIFCLAIAGVFTLAPYLFYSTLNVGIPWPLAIITALILGALISVSFYQFNHFRLTTRNASEGAHLVSSLGMYIIIVQLIALFWGKSPKTLRQGLDVVLNKTVLVITRSQGIIITVCIFLIVLFFVVLKRTDLGLKFRAMAANRTQLELLGHNTRRLTVIAFALSGLFASIASLAISFDRGFDPYGGLRALLLAVVAVILGGRGSFVGPIYGALLLGQLRAFSVFYLSAQWQEVITFLVLAILLVFRPEGILRNDTRIERGS
jgi:branched-chain amino acid transport system permease protein